MIRIGIVGTGRIAQRFVRDILMVNDAVLTCVYNPHSKSAERFVATFCDGKRMNPIATSDIDELFTMSDAVYIASPHETHYQYAKTALKAGKHVLCEKPMTLVRKEAEELFLIAEENGLVLREAVKTAYCPGFLKLIEVARSGVIGEICDVEAAFTKLESTSNREFTNIETGGSVTELGTYGMLPIFKLMGCDYKEVQAQSINAPNGVDKYTKLFFTFENGMATAKMGLGVKSEGQLIVSGTKGYILAESPWWMTKKFEVRYEDATKRDIYEEEYIGAGLVYEILGFMQECQGNSICVGVTKEETLSMTDIMEQFLQSDKGLRKGAMVEEKEHVGIWAHRGLSMKCPENTLLAFEKAAQIPNIRGIELDVQLTKDGQVVVFHDETLERVTCGSGRLMDYTLQELREIKIKNSEDIVPACREEYVRIPTFEEVLNVLKSYCVEKNIRINVEFKTGVIHYPGIEEKTYEIVQKYEMEQYMVYSSFWAESVKRIKEIDICCETAMLAGTLSDCIKWGDYARADALHPSVSGLDCQLPERWKTKPVRAWNSIESLYHNDRGTNNLDLREYVLWGVTDIFTNVADYYLHI
ncbi:MAG: glycerophosphodiester phosphodiesterase family protein [Lachnospiraceae bacterium]|nr:glycerophosphodiester phosphodiesterase family protein [Lachnospiraceae bacterium]